VGEGVEMVGMRGYWWALKANGGHQRQASGGAEWPVVEANDGCIGKW